MISKYSQHEPISAHAAADERKCAHQPVFAGKASPRTRRGKPREAGSLWWRKTGRAQAGSLKVAEVASSLSLSAAQSSKPGGWRAAKALESSKEAAHLNEAAQLLSCDKAHWSDESRVRKIAGLCEPARPIWAANLNSASPESSQPRDGFISGNPSGGISEPSAAGRRIMSEARQGWQRLSGNDAEADERRSCQYPYQCRRRQHHHHHDHHRRRRRKTPIDENHHHHKEPRRRLDGAREIDCCPSSRSQPVQAGDSNCNIEANLYRSQADLLPFATVTSQEPISRFASSSSAQLILTLIRRRGGSSGSGRLSSSAASLSARQNCYPIRGGRFIFAKEKEEEAINIYNICAAAVIVVVVVGAVVVASFNLPPATPQMAPLKQVVFCWKMVKANWVWLRRPNRPLAGCGSTDGRPGCYARRELKAEARKETPDLASKRNALMMIDASCDVIDFGFLLVLLLLLLVLRVLALFTVISQRLGSNKSGADSYWLDELDKFANLRHKQSGTFSRRRPPLANTLLGPPTRPDKPGPVVAAAINQTGAGKRSAGSGNRKIRIGIGIRINSNHCWMMVNLSAWSEFKIQTTSKPASAPPAAMKDRRKKERKDEPASPRRANTGRWSLGATSGGGATSSNTDNASFRPTRSLPRAYSYLLLLLLLLAIVFIPSGRLCLSIGAAESSGGHHSNSRQLFEWPPIVGPVNLAQAVVWPTSESQQPSWPPPTEAEASLPTINKQPMRAKRLRSARLAAQTNVNFSPPIPGGANLSTAIAGGKAALEESMMERADGPRASTDSPSSFQQELSRLIEQEANAEQQPQQQPAYRWPFIGLVGVMFLGATGNILVCMAIWRERRLQTATNYFLLSLAVADLLVCILVMPFGIVYEFYGK